METITIVGAGVAGLTAAITLAEAGAPVVLFDARNEPGGRARSLDGPYRANLGPHVLYKDGPFWAWLKERELLPPIAGLPLAGLRLRWGGEVHRTPPLALIPSSLKLRGRRAPVDETFRAWAARHTDERTAELLSMAGGVYSFHHDPGALSAAFVWERTVRALLTPPPAARYIRGGWGSLVDALDARAAQLGVVRRFGERVDAVSGITVVATEAVDARALLDDDTLRWPSGHTLCLDVAFEHRRGDPFIVSDLDEAGWIERFSAPDTSLAPPGEELVQAQMPVRPGESADAAEARLDRFLELSLPGLRGRTTWRRRLVMDGRTGALDEPGTSWRDRPAIARGDGVFIAGDWTAAPGLLSEVSWGSAVEAARGALELAGAPRALRRAA